MIDPKKIDDLVRQLSASLPPELASLDNELRKQFKAVLESAFQRLDLVSREEFDIQVKVLQKTRQKLEALEKQIAELEQQSASEDSD
jgi:BMFP domain-containing protein YqiC